MKLLQRRSYKHLELFKSLFIAFYMGGVEQARKSAKKLKGQTNEKDTSKLLTWLAKDASSEQLEERITNMINGFNKQGII